MKKNELDFSIPKRQSQAAIYLIIYNRFRNVISRFWPFLLIALFTGDLSFKNPDSFTMIIFGLTLFTGVFGIIAYFRYYFWIEGDQLMIKKGVLNHSLTQIPFDRIQTIDFEQNLIHQFFNVVGLKIETAGSTQSEIKMQALQKEEAEALRDFILSQKVTATPSEEQVIELKNQETELIYKIDFPRLLKIGLTENHIRSGFVILFAIFWFVDNINEAGYDFSELGGEYYNRILGSIFLIGGLTMLFILVSMLISVVRIFLRYFDLRLLRSYNGFKVISGLFNRKEVAALDTKIQILSWKQNLIQRWLGYHDLQLKQASSAQLSTKKSIVVPGVNMLDIEKVKQLLFPERDEETVEYYGVSSHYLWRPILILSVIFIPIFIFLTIQQAYPTLAFLVIFYLGFIIQRKKKFTKTFFGLNAQGLFVRGGIFGQSHWMTMHYKIQSTEIRQTPFQHRKDLANFIVHTASGSRGIPYIKLSEAEYLQDYLTYKIEISQREWM